MNPPSSRSQSVKHFLAMEVLERAMRMEAAGEDVVHLEIGEPDFPTPAAAVAAGVEAVRAGRTRYTHSLGLPALRDAIATRLSKTYGVRVDASNVVVTMGSSAGLVLAFATLLDPGDEIVVPDPGYPCYPNIARSLGAVPKPVPVHAANGFAYDPEDVRRAIGPRTKAIVVNSPANPTGTITPAEVLRGLAGLGPVVVSDEVYHGLVYAQRAPSILEAGEEHYVVGGFSKRFAMTGWRVGFLVVPGQHVRALQALQQNLFISAADFSQWAALEALDCDDDAEAMRREYAARRRLVLDGLERLGLDVPVIPQGAFYVFADAGRYGASSMDLALDILETVKVAVTPGIDFGQRGEGFLRFSYATSRERLEEGFRRLETYFSRR